jgi:Protein kinase domain
MLHALKYLHRNNVWHRDIKSSNVLLHNENGNRIIKVRPADSCVQERSPCEVDWGVMVEPLHVKSCVLPQKMDVGNGDETQTVCSISQVHHWNGDLMYGFQTGTKCPICMSNRTNSTPLVLSDGSFEICVTAYCASCFCQSRGRTLFPGICVGIQCFAKEPADWREINGHASCCAPRLQTWALRDPPAGRATTGWSRSRPQRTRAGRWKRATARRRCVRCATPTRLRGAPAATATCTSVSVRLSCQNCCVFVNTLGRRGGREASFGDRASWPS